MRLPGLTILTPLILLWSMIGLAQERAELHLFQYGRTNTEPLMTAFLDFRDMLSEKLPNLSVELSSRTSIASISLLSLKPVTDAEGKLLRPEQRMANLAEKQRYWNDTGALGVLTGHVVQRDAIPFVRTTFFWGNLRGPYEQEMIRLELPVTGELFDSTYDSHSVAIIYAFAHGVQRDCDSAPATIALLSEAHKRAQAVQADSPDLGAELVALVLHAIETIREACNG